MKSGPRHAQAELSSRLGAATPTPPPMLQHYVTLLNSQAVELGSVIATIELAYRRLGQAENSGGSEKQTGEAPTENLVAALAVIVERFDAAIKRLHVLSANFNMLI